MRYLGRIQVVALVLAGSGCAEAFRPHANVVARAGGAELSVARLAEMVASARNLPVERGLVEILTYRWVEVAAVAQRAAAGDSLVDSATVVGAMWPDTRGAAVDSFHTLVIGQRIEVQPAQVDSAYRAGNLRIVGHILKAVNDSMTAEQRAAQRSVAQRLHERLTDGSMDWVTANEQNDDRAAQARVGLLGVLQRGVVHQRFENAAFALGGGELSAVTETPAGYHIIYRPGLETIRADFTETVRNVFEHRQDSIYERHLLETNDVSFRANAPAAIREAVEAPYRHRGSDRVLASFRDEQFTVGDLIRWIQILPPDVVSGITAAPDEQLVRLGESLVSRELIWRQADSAGIAMTPDQYEVIARSYRTQMEQLREATQLYPDSLAMFSTDSTARFDLAMGLVDRYLERGVQDTRLLVPVPPFLAERLMDELQWEVIPNGVRRATEQAASIRAALPTPSGGSE